MITCVVGGVYTVDHVRLHAAEEEGAQRAAENWQGLGCGRGG